MPSKDSKNKKATTVEDLQGVMKEIEKLLLSSGMLSDLVKGTLKENGVNRAIKRLKKKSTRNPE